MRYALRSLLRAPVFTVAVVLTIALGIGAATAVFSVVDRILFRDMPYRDGGRLVAFGVTAPIEPSEFMLGNAYQDWRDKQTPFETVTSMAGSADCDLTEGSPLRLRCGRVEANLLSALGVQLVAGRDFTAPEDKLNAPKVALISYGLWLSRFAGDRAIAGRTFSLDGQTATVAGVLPENFELPTQQSFDLLIPQALPPQGPNTSTVLRAFGRLKSGVSSEQAAEQLKPLFQDSLRLVPPNFRKEVHLSVRSLKERQTGEARLPALLLLGAVLGVLLIACANVANLLLARTVSRSREWAIRLALGATTRQIVKQTLAESLLISLVGGAAGCLIASVLLELFTKLAPRGIPGLERASVDNRVLVFALAASLLCGALFSLVPALYRARATNPRRIVLREGLIIAQIALSLVLVLSATLLMRTFSNLTSAPLGLNGEKVVTASVVLGRSSYNDALARLQFFEQLETKLKGAPGVEVLAVSDTVPPAGPMRARVFAAIEVDGRPRFAAGTGGMVGWRSITPSYIEAFGIPVVKGRGFREEDRAPSENVVLISSLLAARLFPGEEPIGKHLRFGFGGPWYAIVGITADVKNGGIAQTSEPEYYVVRRHAADDDPGRAATIIIRSPLPAAQSTEWVRREVASLDPTLPVKVETMPERIGSLAAGPRFQAALVTLFALVGLALAAIGLYGVIAYLVSQRTREIGVRMAIGATPQHIRNLMLGEAVRWVAVGLLFGLAGSWWVTQWLGKLLFNVPSRDPATFGFAIGVLVLVALVAAWLPANRASRVDPAQALRT